MSRENDGATKFSVRWNASQKFTAKRQQLGYEFTRSWSSNSTVSSTISINLRQLLRCISGDFLQVFRVFSDLKFSYNGSLLNILVKFTEFGHEPTRLFGFGWHVHTNHGGEKWFKWGISDSNSQKHCHLRWITSKKSRQICQQYRLI